MPGGRGPYIPLEIGDDNLQRVRLFNPPVKPGRPPADTDFTAEEWRNLLSRVYAPQHSDGKSPGHLYGYLAVAVLFAFPGLIWGRAIMPLWLIPIVFTFPLWGTLLMGWVFKTAAENLWGIVAFSDVSEQRVATEMLANQRCPSCAYRPPTGEGRRRTCSECGAVWKLAASLDP